MTITTVDVTLGLEESADKYQTRNDWRSRKCRKSGVVQLDYRCTGQFVATLKLAHSV